MAKCDTINTDPPIPHLLWKKSPYYMFFMGHGCLQCFIWVSAPDIAQSRPPNPHTYTHNTHRPHHYVTSHVKQMLQGTWERSLLLV